MLVPMGQRAKGWSPCRWRLRRTVWPACAVALSAGCAGRPPSTLATVAVTGDQPGGTAVVIFARTDGSIRDIDNRTVTDDELVAAVRRALPTGPLKVSLVSPEDGHARESEAEALRAFYERLQRMYRAAQVEDRRRYEIRVRSALGN